MQGLYHTDLDADRNGGDHHWPDTEVTVALRQLRKQYDAEFKHSNFPDFFSGFLIDLSVIKTDTQIELDKSGVIRLFENLVNGISGSAKEIHQRIYPTTNSQYKQGI